MIPETWQHHQLEPPVAPIPNAVDLESTLVSPPSYRIGMHSEKVGNLTYCKHLQAGYILSNLVFCHTLTILIHC